MNTLALFIIACAVAPALWIVVWVFLPEKKRPRREAKRQRTADTQRIPKWSAR